MNRPKCKILIGIPCAGKNYFIKKKQLDKSYRVLSCDDIRVRLSNGLIEF